MTAQLSESDRESLQSELSEVFRQMVRVESGERRQFGDAQLAIVDISYTSQSQKAHHSTRPTTIRQTVLLSTDAELDLPAFTLSATIKGVAGKLLSLLGGMGDINFDDSPIFSSSYHLHGWSESPVRLLFSKTIRDYFSKHAGWNLIGNGKRLAVYHHNIVCAGEVRDEFIDEALEIVSLFQQSEEQLDALGNVRRETTGDDMLATAERMGGMAGTLLARQLRKNLVTDSELDGFASQAPPRDIPPGLAKQVIGDNLALVFLGALFVIGGLVGGSLIIAMVDDAARWIGVPIVILLPLLGGVIMGLTLRHRNRGKRTLRSGVLVDAHVISVNGTGLTVNSQQRYRVEFEWTAQGLSQRLSLNAYGPQVYLARKFLDNGDSLRVLVDPQDPSHGIAIDLIMVVGE